eukprot:CAMPEP_0181126128 /NCGR_PEP_ID=MMETSP1071-20121207/27443_1 /TAXON_ID=35127 /ORGANISM="Thalassiosira sp., Strain NH16" /LENGTH=357 /DNA_ID=CAMNT_0023211667 /DNA_START=17 /DNA_END=1090 /DNA_ORIENTATION=+
MIRQAATCFVTRRGIALHPISLPTTIGAASQHNNNGGVLLRSHASSSSSSTSKSNVAVPPAARPTTPPVQPRGKGQEAIEKSERLHAELREMIEAQKAVQAEELQRPLGSNVLSFLRASKPEIVNIFFAFVCVLLAYQIHGMRAGIKRLLVEGEGKDCEIGRLRNILANLSEEGGNTTAAESSSSSSYDDGEGANNDDGGDSFPAKLARKCAGVVRRIFEESEKRAGYSWILGRKLAGGDAVELERLADELYPVVLAEVRSAVGDAAFTPEELKDRRFAALKGGYNDESSASRSGVVSGEEDSAGVGATRPDARMGDLMEILEEVHSQDLTDEKKGQAAGEIDDDAPTKVRRTRYAI